MLGLLENYLIAHSALLYIYHNYTQGVYNIIVNGKSSYAHKHFVLAALSNLIDASPVSWTNFKKITSVRVIRYDFVNNESNWAKLEPFK